jgi:hypothetical protein
VRRRICAALSPPQQQPQHGMQLRSNSLSRGEKGAGTVVTTVLMSLLLLCV